MSNFEKIILPLFESGLESGDLTSENGFIDCFTGDIDRPAYENEFFIVFNDDVRNEKSEKIARKLSFFPWLKRTYTKRINGVPYFVYSFHIKPEISKLYKKALYLTPAQKATVLKFWGYDDEISNKVLGNNLITTDIEHNIPANDYYSDDEYGLVIPKTEKGTVII